MGEVRRDFYNKIDHIECNTTKDMIITLMCVEKFIEDHQNICEITHILNGLYESGTVTEDAILRWHQYKSKNVSEELSVKIRTQSIPFINWLKTADIVD